MILSGNSNNIYSIDDHLFDEGVREIKEIELDEVSGGFLPIPIAAALIGAGVALVIAGANIGAGLGRDAAQRDNRNE